MLVQFVIASPRAEVESEPGPHTAGASAALLKVRLAATIRVQIIRNSEARYWTKLYDGKIPWAQGTACKVYKFTGKCIRKTGTQKSQGLNTREHNIHCKSDKNIK